MQLGVKNSCVYLGLTHPKSPDNVGGVMRAAGCYGVESVFYTGRRYTMAAKFQTDTQGIAEKIPLTEVDCLLQAKQEGMQVVCVELSLNAIPLPEFKHPPQALYIFGPEDGSISQEVIDKADAVVYVPTIGCMNLAATVNVLLYDRLAKSLSRGIDNQLIRNSRDTNNRTRVKRK